MKNYFFVLIILISQNISAQSGLAPLTVQKIMRDEKWIGTSPSNPYWSSDCRYLLFNWNPEKALSDSLYFISKENIAPQKASYEFLQTIASANSISYNSTRTAYTFSLNGDIFLADIKSGKQRRVTQTLDLESRPVFSFNDAKIVYLRSQNLYAWDIATGLTTQLTDFKTGADPAKEKKEARNTQEKWLEKDQLENFDVLRSRKQKKDIADSINKKNEKHELKQIYIDDKQLNNVIISPDGRFITYRLFKKASDAIKRTIVPNYVTESGFTEDIPGRTKVGEPQGTSEFFVYETKNDTIIKVRNDEIPGITDLPDYVKFYPVKDTSKKKLPVREVNINGPIWSPRGTYAVVDIRSKDNKDRWLMLLDAATGKLTLLSRQRDEAWIGGPGIGFGFGASTGWIDENNFWYQSEETGYSHLYKVDVATSRKTALTSGKYEVQQAQLSADKKYFYIVTNEVNPGEQQFYRLPINGSKAERITTMTGANQVVVSPDEKQISILYSYCDSF